MNVDLEAASGALLWVGAMFVIIPAVLAGAFLAVMRSTGRREREASTGDEGFPAAHT